jgi:hypothetical protein
MLVLHDAGKIGLKVTQLGQSSLNVTGTGDPLRQVPSGAECLDRSRSLDSESVAQHLGQIEHGALRIVELPADYGQILSALESIGVTVAQDPTTSPVDRSHLDDSVPPPAGLVGSAISGPF